MPNPKIGHTAVEKEKPKSFWEHPLTITVISFLLTGLIGAFISYEIQRRSADTDRTAKQYEASTNAIAAFSDALYTRYTRAGFLVSSLRRHATPEEIIERKKSYDEAPVAQESTLLGKELLIREALQQSQYSSFESLYDDRVRPRFHDLDNLVTDATDHYLRDPKTTISFDPIHKAYADTRDCSYALINLVFLDVSAKQYIGKANQAVDSSDEALLDFNAQCPAPTAPAAP